MSDYLDYNEFKDFILSQGATETEFNEIVEFYNIHRAETFNKDEFRINFIQDAKEWLDNIISQIENNQDTYVESDFIQSILVNLTDEDKILYDFTSYLLEKDDSYAVYCKKTNRIIFFET